MNQPAVLVDQLTRTFRTYRKEPGIAGALRGLWRRRYDLTTAVDRISFQIEPGEIVGFLGANGAGKTTSLKMLAGLVHPTSGKATVLGHIPWNRDDAFRRQFALLLGQKNQLWWDLPAQDSLELNGRIYGIPPRQFRKTVAELSEMLLVRDQLKVMVRELSLGERMKMELIAALLHGPKLLLLDEPTIGLDVVSQKIVREFLRDYNRRHNTTILLTSHYMADIEALCRRVILIDHGKLFFDGPLSDILERYADQKVINIQVEDSTPDSSLELNDLGTVLERNPGQVKLSVERRNVISVCKLLLDRVAVRDIVIQEISIEEVVRRIFAGRQAA
jgi:ABC-2 type transport system ATP-binding protein